MYILFTQGLNGSFLWSITVIIYSTHTHTQGDRDHMMLTDCTYVGREVPLTLKRDVEMCKMDVEI